MSSIRSLLHNRPILFAPTHSNNLPWHLLHHGTCLKFSTRSHVPKVPLLLPALTQSDLTIHMRHVRSQHLCPKADLNSLVPIQYTKYDGE
jgi:hypothetical protein